VRATGGDAAASEHARLPGSAVDRAAACQRGSATVVLLAVVVAAAALVHGVARVAAGSHARVRARTAADAAALAGADALALGHGCSQARRDAAATAAANGAGAVTVRCDGWSVTAVVRLDGGAGVGAVEASARAEVDLSCLPVPCG